MRVTILGPLAVDDRDGTLSPRDRVVLSVLVLRCGEVVSAERLADALWGDEPPASAGKVVQGCVVRLRKVLGRSVIETHAHGYRLALAPEDVDLHRFERLLGRARELLALRAPDRALRAAEEALALWRGQPFEDVEGWDAARIEAARIDELRQEAEEVRVDAALQAGRHHEVLSIARGLVDAAPTREKRWELLALAQHRSGSQADALRTLHEARRRLAEEVGIDPGPGIVELELAILRQDDELHGPTIPSVVDDACPWPGLLSYSVADADGFAGRGRELDECLARLARDGVLVVAGPSGSGKSSLVRAGVAGRLGRDGRQVAVLTPGTRPFDALARRAPSEGCVLVVDQFEEVVTTCEDPSERDAFFAALATHAESGLLVIAVRADRLGDLSEFPAIAGLVERGLFLLGPMDEAALREAIERPARDAGLLLEPGLVDLVVRDVLDEPGALPLMSHALQQTWTRRDGRTLTVAGYADTGGIRSAVAHSAEEVYAAIDLADQPKLRDLLLRLVTPVEDGAPARARLPHRAIAADPGYQRLVERLVDARLLTTDGDVVELAHEALARAWPRFKDWLAEDVDGVRVLRHLIEAAAGWDALGRPSSELYRGERLAGVVAWRERSSPELTAIEEAFVDASVERQREELRAAEVQVERERRTVRRLRWLVSGVALLAVVSLAAGAVAVQQRQTAEHRADETRAGELAGLATLAIEEDPERAILLGLAALERTDEMSAELLSALHRATQSTRVTSMITGDFSADVAQSADGSLLAAVRTDRTGYLLLDASSGRTVADVTTANEITDYGLAFDPTGSTLAVTERAEAGAAPTVELFDVGSGRLVSALEGFPGLYCCSTQFDPAGRWLGTLDAATMSAVVWDLVAGGPPRYLGPAYDFEFAPDGTSIVVGNGSRLQVFDIATAQQVREVATPAGVEYWDFELDPTGRFAVLVSPGDLARRVDVIDLGTGAVRGSLDLRVPLLAQFSPDGQHLAVTGEDSLVRVYETEGLAERFRLAGTSGPPSMPFFAPDGSRLSAAGNGEIRTWDVSAAGPRVLGNLAVSGGPLDRLVVDADESTAYATVYTDSGLRSSVHRVDMASGEDTEVLEDVPYYFSTRPLLSRDLSVMAAIDDSFVSELTPLPSGDPTRLEPCDSVRAFDLGGRVAAIDSYLLCEERGEAATNTSRIVDLETGDTLLDLRDRAIFAADFGPPGDDGLPRRAVVEERDSGDVTLYDLATGESLGTYVSDAGRPASLALSPDGARLALLMDTGRLVVLDVARFADGDDETDPTIFDLVAHAAGNRAVAFSGSGLIATGSSLDGVRIWSPDGELVASVPTNQEDTPTFTFALGTDTLYYEDGDGVIRRFAIDGGDVTQLARSVLTRGFTPQECARYFADEPCPEFDP